MVWNPYVEGAASMADFEPKDGWKNMVWPQWQREGGLGIGDGDEDRG